MAQTIISISREFGSAGHVIAEQIAKNHGLNFYDRRMLDEIANENNLQVGVLEKYDEKPRNAFLSRRVGAFSNSMEEIVAEMQFDYIRKKSRKRGIVRDRRPLCRDCTARLSRADYDLCGWRR